MDCDGGVFLFSSRRRHTRCALVTGVQTCALPILPQYLSAGLCATASEDWTHRQLAELFRQTHGLSLCRAVGEFRKWIHEELTKLDQVVDKRSEERRVGKGCVRTVRSRGSRPH